MKYFAASTGGFYDDSIHGAPLRELVEEVDGQSVVVGFERNPDCLMPADVVEVSDEEHAALFARGGAGIVAGPDGRPVLEAEKPETRDSMKARALALLRAERSPILSALDGLQASTATAWIAQFVADPTKAPAILAKAQQLEALKAGLRNAPSVIPWDSCPDYETMRQAGKAYYASLVKGASADVVTAFKEVV